jgi:hypothetical protein
VAIRGFNLPRSGGATPVNFVSFGVMNSPWLDVPLADYEGHMALPGIEQAQLLSDIFAGVLAKFSPRSVAVIGCAGGNGFDRIPPAISRVVGLI